MPNTVDQSARIPAPRLWLVRPLDWGRTPDGLLDDQINRAHLPFGLDVAADLYHNTPRLTLALRAMLSSGIWKGVCARN